MSFCSGEKKENASVSLECAEWWSAVALFLNSRGKFYTSFILFSCCQWKQKDSFQSVLVVGFGQGSGPKKMLLVDGE